MSFTLLHNREDTQDGRAWPDGGGWRYHHTSGDMPLDPGSWLVFRMPCDIPAGSVINAAHFEIEVVRFGTDVTQSTTVDTYLEVNSDPYPTPYPYPGNDTFIGQPGSSAFPPWPRTIVNRGDAPPVTTVINYTAGQSSAFDVRVNLTAWMQALVNDPLYKTGSYIAVLMYCSAQTGDLRVRGRDHPFASPAPQMHVDFTEPYDTTTERTDVNVLHTYGANVSVDTWGSGDMFGEYQPGSVSLDTTFGYESSESIKWTATTSSTKASVLGNLHPTKPGQSWVFSGWVYIPSIITTPVEAIFWLLAHGVFIPERDQWTYFSTRVVTHASGSDVFAANNVLPQIKVHGPTVAGWHFWADHLTLLKSNIRQRPWKDNYTPMQQPAGRGWATRSSKAKTYIDLAGTSKPRRMYVKGEDGLWASTVPDRTSLRLNELPDTLRLDNMSDKTLQEWEALEVPE